MMMVGPIIAEGGTRGPMLQLSSLTLRKVIQSRELRGMILGGVNVGHGSLIKKDILMGALTSAGYS
jgi:hypothetical protein